MTYVAGIMNDTGNNCCGDRGELPFTDIHCHCLPGLDDGPATILESLEICRTLANEGVAVVVGTPHQLGRFHGHNEAPTVREAACRLNDALETEGIPLKVLAGGEVRVDERICRLLETDNVLTLADSGKYILLELPHQVFIDIDPLLIELLSMDVCAIIAHAERIPLLAEEPELLSRWLDHSAHVQITASSLLGRLGKTVRRIAWRLLSSGAASIVATDAHDTEFRRPQLRAAFERISSELGEDLAYRVCAENPARVVNGEELLPVLSCQQQEVA